MTASTSGQLADPLVFVVTGLRREDVGQVTVHSTVPPVVLLVLILYEGYHHLHESRHSRPKPLGIHPLIITAGRVDTL